tara:strand:+ start:25 stop:1740 length:1716 start_codon:yes stop_codon:yes gene_type:complete
MKSKKELLRIKRLKAHKKRFIDSFDKNYVDGYELITKNITDFNQEVILKCKKHGNKSTKTDSVIFNRFGCKECRYIKIAKKRKGVPRVEFNQFARDFKETFGGKLKLISKKEDYKTLSSTLEAKCLDPSHKPVIKKAVYFRRGMGCVNCNESQGERLIRIALDKLDIEYIQEKRFASCRDKKELSFDFYLPEFGVLIEFQGFQHFKKHDYFGGEKAFKLLIKRDLIKKEWVKENNIPLLEISSYKEIRKKILLFIDKFSAEDVKDALNNLLETEKEWTQKKWKEYLKKLTKVRPEYDFSNTSWEWGQRDINYKCQFPSHGLRKGDLQNLLKGHGCSRCAGQDVNLDDVIARSQEKFGNKFDFSKAKFTSMKIDIEIICDVHDSIFLSPEHHLRLASGCVDCSPQSKKGDDKNFLERAKKFNGRFEYLYDTFSTDKKILILCKKHNHKFKTLQGDHTRYMTGCCEHCLAENKSKSKGIPITVGGKEYGSVTEAAKAYNLKGSTVRKRIRNGATIEEAFRKVYKGNPIIVEGKKFPSFLEAARAYGLLDETVRKRIQAGKSINEAFGVANNPE